MREPLSTITNLAYIVAGVQVALRGSWISVYVGLAFIALGLASGFYHWVGSPLSQLTDERGIYVAFTALIVAAWAPVVPPVAAVAMGIVCFVGSVLLALSAADPDVDSFVVTPILALFALAGVAVSVGFSTALGILIFFLLSVATRTFHDLVPIGKEYRDTVHGLWHLMSCLAMYMLAHATLT